MQEFGEIFAENCRRMSKVVVEHVLWGRQAFECEHLQVINDGERIGVIIKGRELFVYKRNIVKETDNMVSDGRLTIYVTKL